LHVHGLVPVFPVLLPLLPTWLPDRIDDLLDLVCLYPGPFCPASFRVGDPISLTQECRRTLILAIHNRYFAVKLSPVNSKWRRYTSAFRETFITSSSTPGGALASDFSLSRRILAMSA